MKKPGFLSMLFVLVFIILGSIFVLAYSAISIPSLPHDRYFKMLSALNINEPVPDKTYNIGIVLPSGHLAEQEESKRFCIAAQKLNWKCYIFEYDWKLVFDSPTITKLYQMLWGTFTKIMAVDFIIELQPSVKKLSPFGKIPVYLAISQDMSATLADISAFLDLESKPDLTTKTMTAENYKYYFWKNIGDYDGYIDAGYRYGWLNKFNLYNYTSAPSRDAHIRPIMEGYPSVYDTNFIPLEYKEIFYCGDNWDALRRSKKYKLVMTELEKLGILNVFGPKSNWTHLKSAYKGFVPSDGFSLLAKSQDYGIALVLHNKESLRDGMPSSRIFEAAASSLVIISDQNKFVKDEFGSCVLYINVKKPADDIIEQITSHLKWIRDNPKKAGEMAKCAHAKFRNKFLLESMLTNLAGVYEQQKRHLDEIKLIAIPQN